MKKLVTILLALAMILCLSTAAFADTTKVEITETVGDTANRVYYGYKILDLSTSHKDDGHGVDCPQKDNPNAPHDDNCFNYRYTLNDKFKEILQNEVVGNATPALWIANDMIAPATAEAVTETHVLVYLSSMTSDGGSNAGTLRTVADRIYRAIQAAGIDKDATLTTGNENILADQGYWLIADVTEGLENHDAHSLVILDTKADSHITLNPKTALPLVEKKVKDLDDSENASTLELDWKDSADHDIDAKPIPFKLTATLPSNVDSYETYQMIFHDTMAAGLTLDPASFEIFLYSTKNVADGDNDMNDCLGGAPVYTTATDPDLENENFKITVDPTNNTFEVTVKNVKNLGDTKTFNAIVVTYKATLNNNAVLGKDGNQNTVYLEYSNDPYGNGTGKTREDKVTVFTYGLQINKIDGHDHALAGATFALYKYSKADGAYVQVGENIVSSQENPLTTFNWKGLDDGTYILKEVAAPEGYNKIEDIHFVITAVHTDGDEPKLVEFKSEVMGTGALDTGLIVKEVVNHTGTVLPSTGAKGTMMLITAGTVLVVLAAVFMITRKKMSIYED